MLIATWDVSLPHVPICSLVQNLRKPLWDIFQFCIVCLPMLSQGRSVLAVGIIVGLSPNREDLKKMVAVRRISPSNRPKKLHQEKTSETTSPPPKKKRCVGCTCAI